MNLYLNEREKIYRHKLNNNLHSKKIFVMHL